MAVTNLTNTTWVFKDTLSISSSVTYNVEFSSKAADDLGELEIKLSTNKMEYFIKEPYGSYSTIYQNGTWSQNGYRMITITGGADVTNANLISWISANAIQLNTTNLTNTTWVINSTTCTSGYGQFNINFDAIVRGSVELFGLWQLGIGYSSTKKGQVATTNTIALGSSLEDASVGDTITITSGQDVTNANLISWLTANATQLPMTTSIIIGVNTLLGVDTIKVQDSVDTTQYKDFIYGATPSSTTSIKLGNQTLNGVNQISVMGTDDNYKSFCYVAPVSGFTASFTRGGGHLEHNDDWSNIVQYSVDNGTTYQAFTMTVDAQEYYIPADITGITQIKFRVKNYDAYKSVKVKQGSTILCQSTTTSWVESNNIELSANTSFEISCILDN